ncbi:MAG: BspA family leucine-rich repeat surface protein [Candidatus Thiodubiliella endoseptemdiera]|uniref:BspA family leucine-rich repeat surface protein n=1 Tax=Candidatus Thiodubiliella endoseptemdiera TaxID=2738886 RepID=A0A853F4K9_9GAMM|nr:BspA family leucine-rich repeat surface protein [Candidatus Thiodubiliella endoseptemdiera]
MKYGWMFVLAKISQKMYLKWDVEKLIERQNFKDAPVCLIKTYLNGMQPNPTIRANRGTTHLYLLHPTSNRQTEREIKMSKLIKVRNKQEVRKLQRQGVNMETLDVSEIRDASYMFRYQVRFNDDISKWNTSNFTATTCMFNNAKTSTKTYQIGTPKWGKII